MKKLVTVFLFVFLSILLVACGGNNTVENERKILEERRAEREQTKEEKSTNVQNLKTPEELAEEISVDNYPAEFDKKTKTFIFIMPKEAKVELLNEDDLYFTEEEHEQFLEETKSNFITLTEIVIDYYDESYSTVLALDNAEEVLLRYEDSNLVENNLDMRNIIKKEYLEIDKEQYRMLGDYINIYYRNYVDELEALIADSYNNIITQEQFIEELDKGYSELTYYCNNLLLEGSEDSEEILSEDIGDLVTNSFLSCTGLQNTYLNFMITSSDGVAASEMLEESIQYFKKAKNIYDEIDI